MSDNHGQIRYIDSKIPQPWHLVRPSVWPLVGAFSAGFMFLAAVLFMHKDKINLGSFSFEVGLYAPIAGLFAVLAVMFFWWKDIVHEAVVEKAHSPFVAIGLRYGMLLFIASEVMFFAAFFWAYFSVAFFPPAVLGGVWPPADIKTFNVLEMPFFMTLILLLSGTTVTWAHHAVMEGKRRDLIIGLALTVALGLSFTFCQALEYHHADFSLKSGMFGSTFFMATGFHGFHVIIGTIFLAVCLFRAIKGHFTPKSHFGLLAAAWYWHFVDVVWIFLFFAVYCYGSR